jgi:hypothetical protein
MPSDSAESSPQPGERWRVRLQPVDATDQHAPEVTVTLGDFDARTDTWTVKQDGEEKSVAVPAKYLVRRV